MGAGGSSIKSYQVGQQYFPNSDSALKVAVSPATNLEDGQKYTVFQFAKENGVLDEGAEKYIEVLKTTRHPYILKYLTLFSESKNETVVTEHVIPLDVAVEKQEKEEICTGLRNVLEALLFLHERSFICHNGVSVSAIFVSDNGEWKLASFETSTKVLPLSKKSFDNDIAGFFEFALSVLEYLKDESETTLTFMARLEKELAVENKEVCTLRAILEDPFFKFPYLEALDGIEKLALKSNAEKIELFKDLPDTLSELSPYVVCRRFIPNLFSHMVLTDQIANELFMQHLFASGNDYCVENDMRPLLDHDHFVKYSLPKILALYASRDLTVRLTLMRYLPLYVDCIEKEILQDEILPEILVGLKDSNNKVVQETFLALASIVSILGGEMVVGGESTTYFYDRKPDFSRSKGKAAKDTLASTKVSHIIKTNTTTNAMDEKLSEERRQKRLEREKQREEQRQKREERRKEREKEKMKKELSLSTSGNSIDGAVIPSQDNLPAEAVVENKPGSYEENTNENDSEAEWEGFEVLSNSSDHETKDSLYEPDLISPVTGYKSHDGIGIDNNIDLSIDNKRNKDKGNSESSLSSSTSSSHVKENDNEILPFINSKITQGVNPSQNKDSKPANEGRQCKEPAKSKSMNLSGKKSEKVKKDSSNSNTDDKDEKNKTTNKLTNPQEVLGNEFDIKIEKNKFTMEPDYFADMAPSIGHKNSQRIIIPKNAGVSSKFNMELSVEESTGWDDDGGWENDEEIF